MLLLIFLFTNWLCLTEHHFPFLGKWVIDETLGGIWISQTPMEFSGPLLWALPFGLSLILLVLLVLHLYFRATLDAYIHSGQFVQEFYGADPEFRLKFFKDVLIGFTVAIAILLAGLARA